MPALQGHNQNVDKTTYIHGVATWSHSLCLFCIYLEVTSLFEKLQNRLNWATLLIIMLNNNTFSNLKYYVSVILWWCHTEFTSKFPFQLYISLTGANLKMRTNGNIVKFGMQVA